ncbi:MAG: hypothetical protein NDF52_06880 [archaeon YNP-WB-062]|nr:hypothetical protein [Candidatus Culexarchaeum yellowstonense]
MNADDKIYLFRGVFGLLTAIICITLNLSGGTGVMLGLTMYILTIPLIRRVLKIKPSDLKMPENLYISGLAPYLALWLITWITVYTFQVPHPFP